jgi:Virulence factor
MAELTVIWWRDIPAQVIATRRGSGRRESAKTPLTDRFQEAIDMAATRVGLIGTDEYLEQWHREARACGDDLQAEADAEAHRLERAFGDPVLDSLVRSGGIGAPADGEQERP